MSNIGEYFKDKELDKREIIKQDIMYKTIAKKFVEGKLDDCLPNFDFSILKKEQIENSICALYGWERTSKGFEYRNNFHFDESGKDILFDRYFITKSNDQLKSDGSKISDNFLKEHSDILESVMKIYHVYEALAPRFETDIKQGLDSMERRWVDNGNLICIDGDKWSLLEEEKLVNGVWTTTGDVRPKELLEEDAGYCQQTITYQWLLSDEWECGE